jgi:hypothetical protein
MCLGNIQDPIQADLRNTATALAGVAPPGAIDQDLEAKEPGRFILIRRFPKYSHFPVALIR